MPDERNILDRLGNRPPMRKSNIELPNTRGTKDPRLSRPTYKDVGEKIVSGYRTIRKLGSKR
jgi:hypothetical protein